jgi:hypothetical protein
MTLTRPRLMALSLCALLALALFFLLRTGPAFLAPHASDLRSFDVREEPGMASYSAAPVLAEPPPPEDPVPAAGQGASAIAVEIPRIAYTYGYSFRLEAAGVAAVQERHLALCRRLGPARCRVTAMRRGVAEGSQASAALSLQVAASLAETFGRGLSAISAEAGAQTIDRSIAAEDLSRQMIDSEARIRTRETLIRRLTSLLETRSGNIQQAVEAERAINNAQEELEVARAWLGEMRGRVAMSAVEISYLARTAAPTDSSNPVAGAIRQVGTSSASSLGAMILLVGIALPWLVLGLLIFLLARFVHRRQTHIPDS